MAASEQRPSARTPAQRLARPGEAPRPQKAVQQEPLPAPSGSHGTVVVVEDDRNIADLLDLYLRSSGFRVLQASDAERGLELIAQEKPSCVLLDIGLPGPKDGLETCKEIRRSSDIPVIIVTARDEEVDRIVGLELGADDYVTKPFSPRELVARVRAVVRRSEPTRRVVEGSVDIGELHVDSQRREVRVGEETVQLTAREFDLLVHFVENKGIVRTRQQLLDAVWGPGWFGDERTVDVHVRQLRRKLGEALPLATVWGVGYRCG